MTFLSLARVTLLIPAILFLAPMTAQAADITPFIGKFKGSVVMENEDGLEPRDTDVEITGDNKTFSIKWSTARTGANGSRKVKSYAIDFRGTDRDDIFQSAMRKNKFGARIPLDPIKGDPYVWARIEGETLTVFAMLITPEGGYEMQQYDRTLTATGGLKLRFIRFNEGGIFRTIEADLVRVE